MGGDLGGSGGLIPPRGKEGFQFNIPGNLRYSSLKFRDGVLTTSLVRLPSRSLNSGPVPLVAPMTVIKPLGLVFPVSFLRPGLVGWLVYPVELLKAKKGPWFRLLLSQALGTGRGPWGPG